MKFSCLTDSTRLTYSLRRFSDNLSRLSRTCSGVLERVYLVWFCPCKINTNSCEYISSVSGEKLSENRLQRGYWRVFGLLVESYSRTQGSWKQVVGAWEEASDLSERPTSSPQRSEKTWDFGMYAKSDQRGSCERHIVWIEINSLEHSAPESNFRYCLFDLSVFNSLFVFVFSMQM